MTIYNSFIVSSFNYCPLVWHFCSASSTNKIEKIQERGLRFINNDSTSSLQALLTSTNTLPLHVRRMKQMASEVYKIVNDIAPAYIKDFIVNIKKPNYNFRRENQASLPAVKSTRYGLRSFCYEAARIWNCLPNDVRRLSPSLSSRDRSMLGMVTFADALLVQFRLLICSLLLQYSFNSLTLSLFPSFDFRPCNICVIIF